MTGNTISPGRETGTALCTGTGTAQGYRDAQLPAEISGCHTTGRHNGCRKPGQNGRQHHKPRQRTRYCPRTGTGTAQEYRDAQQPAEISGCRTTKAEAHVP